MIWSGSCRGNMGKQSYFLKVSSVAACLYADGSESMQRGNGRMQEREGMEPVSAEGQSSSLLFQLLSEIRSMIIS